MARLRYFVTLAAVLSGTLATLPSSSAWAESVRTSALTPGSEQLRETDLPTVLAPSEALRYRRIFGLQSAGRWADADSEIRDLRDRLLIGAVEAQRYLHKAYPASYAELAAWLAAHADEPEAKAIYALALRRHPAAAAPPTRPTVAVLSPRSLDEDAEEPGAGDRRLTAGERRQAQELRREIRALAANEPRRAELTLAGYDARHLLTLSQQDELRTVIAEGYLDLGRVQEALSLSAATHSPAYAAAAHWQAGLAAWRLGRYGEAGTHFQAVARAPGQSSWMTAAAAFWAARVELRNRRPELFNYWLGIAAEHSRTFYGLLARRTLGIDTYLDFYNAPFTALDADMLAAAPAGRRAMALLQAGEPARAEAELRVLAPRASAELLEALVAVADRANMPALSLQLAGLAAEGDGRHHDHALYPVPRWTPIGGFTVDRALLFAMMRQESQFLPQVQSNAGAVGLMQLMPATAHAMARRTGMPLQRRGNRPARDPLAEPELNLALAQEYIVSLIEQDQIGDNLVLIAAAYNCGPGALQRWRSAPELGKDPLLFIESIPSRETRNFTEHVLANYWIYRQRLGQSAPDLDALAAGRWPTYTTLDTTTAPERRDAENR
ncbi:MAG: lytic transglycosylase domain-containing protein [Stellaceae bacterium]